MSLVFGTALEQTMKIPSRSHCIGALMPQFSCGRLAAIAVFQKLLKRDSGGGEAVHESR